MKRKNVLLSIAVVLVLLAVYGIWHYSPLRHLTRSQPGSDQTQIANNRGLNQPVIVTKKILPEPAGSQQTAEIPQPLVVLKNIAPEDKSQPAESQVKTEDLPLAEEKTPPVVAEAGEKPFQAAPEEPLVAKAEKKSPRVATDDAMAAKLEPSQSSEPAKPLKPLPAQKQAVSVKQEAYHPYSIMLSSCRLPQSASKIVSDYQKVGLTPYVVKVRLQSGGEWLRVLTGHYQTRREALKAKQEHRLSGAIVKRTPYTNLIGTYTSPHEMQVELNRIKKLGYSPYFLKTQADAFKLMVGAFVTKEGAENQQVELQAKGIQTTVIIR